MASEGPIGSSIVVESKLSAMTGVCNRILSALDGKSFSQDDIFAIHLAVEEAFLNAVKHGNKMDPCKKVQVDFSVDREKVEILVTDQGNGFHPENVPDPRVGRNLYKPEGRGLFLINSYMDIVRFNERGNSVRMVRYRERPSLNNGGPTAPVL
jgi:serine/threonine-protein kinase RsbW